MPAHSFIQRNLQLLDRLQEKRLTPLDLIRSTEIREKLVELVLNGVPAGADQESERLLAALGKNFQDRQVSETRVVVFGGGTGLANVIGGDSRQESWLKNPFSGLKELFPSTRAVVCVTDDGGSTGELLKDFPMIALGDIRHVLLSSIQRDLLMQRYRLSYDEAVRTAGQLHRLFNYRFDFTPRDSGSLIDHSGVELEFLPEGMRDYLVSMIEACFSEPTSLTTISRPHCLGNLIIMAVLARHLPPTQFQQDYSLVDDELGERLSEALDECALSLGAAAGCVRPCSFTPAQLRFLYTNGVEVTGEQKSGEVRRGYPVDRVVVDFCGIPQVSRKLLEEIRTADLLVMAPGSLYSSIIPVLQMPGIAAAIRDNSTALKLLIANLWVQAGETDKSITDPERKFHVSDMLRAYDRNFPGGIQGLCDQVLCMSLQGVPASVIQNYAVEGKVPIYLDKEVLQSRSFNPVECGFFSPAALRERQVIQHDPYIVAQTIKTLYLAEKLLEGRGPVPIPQSSVPEQSGGLQPRRLLLPSARYRRIKEMIDRLPVAIEHPEAAGLSESEIRTRLVDIIWSHKDISLDHLANIRGITCVADTNWRRDQRWDNVFSFFDPSDGRIKIRQDRFQHYRLLEVAFLIATGQALLGNYAAAKRVEPVYIESYSPGRIFHLHLRLPEERDCFLDPEELEDYLHLARMIQQGQHHFTRMINGNEGFTPPGLLFGVMYAWYLNNEFASHIEYKMSVLKVAQTDLIPEQLKMRKRRQSLVAFFRNSVFGKI